MSRSKNITIIGVYVATTLNAKRWRECLRDICDYRWFCWSQNLLITKFKVNSESILEVWKGERGQSRGYANLYGMSWKNPTSERKIRSNKTPKVITRQASRLVCHKSLVAKSKKWKLIDQGKTVHYSPANSRSISLIVLTPLALGPHRMIQ